MPSKQQQADSEIHEDQLLNFLVNRLDEEVSITLGENAQITSEEICEVLVGACADGTSISTLCENSTDSPRANAVLYHLRTKFELEQLERVGNTLLQRDVLDVLPEQVEVRTTSTCGPTTVTKTIQRASTTRKRSVEPPRSTRTRHCTHA